MNKKQQSASPSGQTNQNLKLAAKDNEKKRKRRIRVLKVRTVDLRERERAVKQNGEGVFCIVPLISRVALKVSAMRKGRFVCTL